MTDPFAAREPSAAAPPPVRPVGYEFTATQEQVIASLARLMQIVGGATVLFGGLSAVSALASRGVPALVALVQGLVMLVLGVLTFIIGNRFGRIAETSGRDIAHLMDALGGLRTLYLIQVVAIAVGVAAIGLLVVILLLR